jgi:tripartite-type tricarboxylate transporter receptor subunit TctC
VQEKLSVAVTKILHSPEVTKRFATLGLEPVGQDLAATDAYIKSEIAKWAKVVKAAKIAPN